MRTVGWQSSWAWRTCRQKKRFRIFFLHSFDNFCLFRLLSNIRRFPSQMATLPLFILFFLGLHGFVNGRADLHRRLVDSTCPLNFTVLRKFIDAAKGTEPYNTSTRCRYSVQGLHLVQAEYLRTTGLFLPPANSSQSCWGSYEALVNEIYPNFNIRLVCGFKTEWISQGCMNITSKSEFEALVSQSSLQDVRSSCNQPLENNSPCASCTTSLSRVRTSYLTGPEYGNVTECSAYPFIYTAGLINKYGPGDDGTAACLFLLPTSSTSSNLGFSKKRRILIYGLVAGCAGVFILGLLVSWVLIWTRKLRIHKRKRKKVEEVLMPAKTGLVSQISSIGESLTLVRFTFDQIKTATENFSRNNIIGMGGYGNVYKGILLDGSEVAVKRFKNMSAAGEASFVHEVEIIASVRHVNLVAIRGYCTESTSLQGYQRIIVCELLKNGSLHDHLFGTEKEKLSWPIRQKIAMGTARGLAYLHYGAQPAIIHRDIKASNILLDEGFEPKVADFGLAKFTQEGMIHSSTRVAGTLGYVAPEYALYGQLTEKSDVYSFGVVLLELLSGKKAFLPDSEGQKFLVADWAWSLVQKGRTFDVIEEGMTEMESRATMEKYVLIGVLASHPQLHSRPTMDQILKIFDSNLPVPSIPDRPLPVVADINDIVKSASSSGSGNISSPAGYQPFNSS